MSYLLEDIEDEEEDLGAADNSRETDDDDDDVEGWVVLYSQYLVFYFCVKYFELK